MNVKEAVQAAKVYVADLYEDEPAKHIGVEEVKFDEYKKVWEVTIGFFRPWDEHLGLAAALNVAADGESARWKKRSFKVIEIDDLSGEVNSMTHRTLASLN